MGVVAGRVSGGWGRVVSIGSVVSEGRGGYVAIVSWGVLIIGRAVLL